jgi:hypothetical protein
MNVPRVACRESPVERGARWIKNVLLRATRHLDFHRLSSDLLKHLDHPLGLARFVSEHLAIVRHASLCRSKTINLVATLRRARESVVLLHL